DGMPRMSPDQSDEVVDDVGRTAHEHSEAHIARADKPPDQAKRDQTQHRVTEQHVNIAPALAFGREKGASEAERQHPVKDTGRHIPYEYALFHEDILIRGKADIGVSGTMEPKVNLKHMLCVGL